MSSMYIRWLIFSCDLLSLYPAVHFSGFVWLSGIIVIVNSNSDSAAPWNIPSLDLRFSQAFSSCCQFHFLGFHGFLYKVWLNLLSSFTEPYHVFLESSQAIARFFRLVLLSRWGWTDLSHVPLYTLRYPFCFSGNKSVSLLASRKSLPLFALLIFSTSSVGKLWVWRCLGRFPWGSLSGSMWSFLWSSIRLLVLLVSICSFRVLVCHEWRWISWTWIYVFHHGLAFFQFDIFLVLFWVNRCVFPLSGRLRFLLILLSCFYPFGFFIMFSWLPYFSTKLFNFSCIQLLEGIVLSLSLLVRISFRCCGMSCFVWIVLPFVDIFLIFILSPVLSGLFPQVVLLFFLVLSFRFCPTMSQRFSFVLSFWPVFVDLFFICVSSRISHPGFDFWFMLFEGIPIFLQTNFAPA